MRILCGTVLVLIGVLVGLLPGPGGLFILIPGLIILLADVHFLRNIAAFGIKFLRKFKFTRLLIKRTRLLVHKTIGRRKWFKRRISEV